MSSMRVKPGRAAGWVFQAQSAVRASIAAFDRREALWILGQVSLLMGLYLVILRWVNRFGRLPSRSYFRPYLVLELVRQPGVWLPALFAAAIVLSAARQRAMKGWKELEQGQSLRLFVGIIVGMCAWVFSTYDYNLYFDQSHSVDRLLLLLLALLVVWRPIFILPFTLLLFSIVSQFDDPLPGQYPWTEMNMVFGILALVSAHVALSLFTGIQKIRTFVFVLLCLIATFYWGSGLGKYHLNWISHRQLHLLVLGAYANGWLGFLEPQAVVAFSKFLSNFTPLMMGFTLVVECGAVLILLNRPVTLSLLAGFILFHLGVFVVSGMFFWKWIVVEAALIAIFFARKSRDLFPVYRPLYFLSSLVLIGFGGNWFRPTNLSWYDTRLAYTIRLEALAQSGNRYALPARSFTPYADMFTLGNFGYLNPDPQITNIWGITQKKAIAQALVGVRTPEEVQALESEYPRRLYDERSSLRFEAFVRRYFKGLNQRGSKATGWSRFHAPPHLWTFSPEPPFQRQEPITKVEVYQLTWLYDEEGYQVFRKKLVREILIQP